MRRATALAAALVASAACSSTSSPPPSSPAPPVSASAAPPAPATSAPAPPSGPALPTLDALAARSSAVAPGMREVARGELPGDAGTAPRVVLVRADTADTCARVAFAAEPAVHASLVNAHGDVLADAPSATDAPLAAHGPVCVRKGDAIAIKIDATGRYAARFVAWTSP